MGPFRHAAALFFGSHQSSSPWGIGVDGTTLWNRCAAARLEHEVEMIAALQMMTIW